MTKLHIVRASAGSGKTFRLTLQYLSYLFTDSDNFRHILAVTFTNKAAEEMKSRIIHVLNLLAKGDYTDYLEPLKKRTGLEEKNIRLKADVVLKKILHHYSYFSVETIDTFFQKIIRSFTREMGIQSGFNIELDENPVLSKAIDNLFDCVDEDKVLLDWLLRFAESRLESSHGWNLKKEVFKLANEIFKEKYKEKSEALAEKIRNKDFMKEYINDLRKITGGFENHLTSLGKKAIDEITNNGFLVTDFFYKERGPAGFLKKMSEGIFSSPNVYVKNVLKNPEKWVNDKNGSHSKEFCERVLHPILENAATHYDSNIIFYKTSKTILSNIYTLGILTDISNQINQLTRDRNLFLLSNSAELINKVIDNNDAPFIYEKTGNYFRNYLIDEFQDTSGFQWKSFKPLISNSLSQGNDCLIVGDVKQSVYRWRNSNWEIMANEVENDFYSGAVDSETLDFNRRSGKNLIDFNNNFFRVLTNIATEKYNSETEGSNISDTINKLFSDVEQKFPERTRDEGYVKFSFINAEEEKEIVFVKLIETLNQLQDSGYRLRDIAILTRGKREGKEIADFLIEYKQKNTTTYRYDVISDESLYVGSSTSVRFIVSVLKHFIAPDEHVNNYYILNEYINVFKKKGNAETILPEYNHKDPETSMRAVLPDEFFILKENKQDYPLPDLMQKIIGIFSLNECDGELGYIMAFKDMILEFTNHYSSNISSFIEYWKEMCSDKSIQGSGSQDAVRVLTIHKSKGLEFEAVIIPFCDWDLDKSNRILWCEPKVAPFNKIEVLPVLYTAGLTSTIFSSDYYSERLKTYVDNLNLLYVAFTRAKRSLICFSSIKNGDSFSKISQFVYSAISQGVFFQDYLNTDRTTYEYGSIQSPDVTTDNALFEEVCKISEYDIMKKLRVAFQAKDYLVNDNVNFQPLNYGKLMHDIFSGIDTIADVKPVIDKFFYQGKINSEEKKFLQQEVMSLFTDIQVNSWFSGEWKPLNERDILKKGSDIKRPDRVLIKGNKAIVIDYKFGNKEIPAHKEQVLEYRSLLKVAGFENVECYLWYITKRKVVQVNEL